MRWVEKVKMECEAAGFTFHKREDDGYWQMLDGNKVVGHNRSLGDLLREVGNGMGIDNAHQ